MEASPTQLPLFPLQLVLLPDELLPLHIFEQRYRRLVARCVETGEPFGIVLRLGDGVAAVGCSARVVAVLEEFPDGRSNIVVRGEEPFRIVAIDVPEDADREPLTASVEYLVDEAEDVVEAEGVSGAGGEGAPLPRPLDELLARLRIVRDDDLVAGEGSAAGDQPPAHDAQATGDEPQSTGGVASRGAVSRGSVPRSYRVAADLDLELSLKERLLESRSETARLAMIAEYLEELIPRLELFETRRDAIRGNGKGD